MNLSTAFLSLTTTFTLAASASSQAYAAFVLDRSGSMVTIRSSGNTRAVDTVLAAQGDITNFFLINGFMGIPANALVFEFHGSTVTQLGGTHTTAAGALAALATVPAASGSTPLAHAICTAKDALVALAPGAEAGQRSVYVYSDGDENSSPLSSCRAGLPAATSGVRCAQQWGSSPAFNSGSWQEAICNLIHAQIQLNVYYFGDFADAVSPLTFFTAVTDLTGGNLYAIDDQSTAPVVNPWRTFGTGCQDFHGFKPSMRYSGTPQMGTLAEVGCRTSAPFPSLLLVGFAQLPAPFDLGVFGAPGCKAYHSLDMSLGFLPYDTMAPIQIPNNPALVGSKVLFQGAHLHMLNNAMGVATSNALEMTITP
ncbi:MAG: hypothetical protein JNK15_23545 [Planctomycetes bacterium]|nr:hypothetical protein [Planctomycetota bacterium]